MKERRLRTEQIAYEVYKRRLLLKRLGDAQTDWSTARKIYQNPLHRFFYHCHGYSIRLGKNIWEPLLAWTNGQAWLSLIGSAGQVSLVIAAVTYVGSEKQRREAEVLNAWQTITNAHQQAGSGGRIQALEFLNASPGANWRRKFPWICSPSSICTWPAENLEGINLSVESSVASTPSNELSKNKAYRYFEDGTSGVYLSKVKLPKAKLAFANLEKANLFEANLQKADLRGANIRRAGLGWTNLKGAVLASAILEEAVLVGADLRGADLSSANLNGINAGDAVAAILDSRASSKRAELSSQAERYSKWAADFEGADLSFSSLREASLWSVNLESADLSYADLESTNLQSANLAKADLSSVNLKAADLSEANLEGTSFVNTDLKEANNLTNDQLVEAMLCNTRLPSNIDLPSNRDCEELDTEPISEDQLNHFYSRPSEEDNHL